MYLSRSNIEQLSKKIVSEYMQLPKVRIQKEVCKIDPFILAENLMKLDVDFQNLSAEKNVFGVTSYYPTIAPILDDDEENVVIYPLDGNTIVIEKDLAFEPMNGKLNFTITHETSHHILRRFFPKDYGIQIENAGVHYYKPLEEKPIEDWEEWQASTLASAILMPEELIRKNMKKVGFEETIKVLNRKYRRADYFKFCDIATMMGVSLTALRIRMKYLNLIEKDFYYNAKAMLDIVVD